ncbi:hypothetical protein O9929_09840 [Vibrio lentus]|nr:hypothetical protein [Vibrio lentus]
MRLTPSTTQVVVANGHKFTQFEQTPAPAPTPVGVASHIRLQNLSQLKRIALDEAPLNTTKTQIMVTTVLARITGKNHIDQEFDIEVQQHNGERLHGLLPEQARPVMPDAYQAPRAKVSSAA